jgi:hypothetical protein
MDQIRLCSTDATLLSRNRKSLHVASSSTFEHRHRSGTLKLATLESKAQWWSAILFPEQVNLAVDLPGRCVATSGSRPKRKASHCLVGGLTSKAGVGAGRDLDRAVLLLIASVDEDVVPLPLWPGKWPPYRSLFVVEACRLRVKSAE